MMRFDTRVLIDARDASSPWHQWAKDQIAAAVAGEGACANTVVVSFKGIADHTVRKPERPKDCLMARQQARKKGVKRAIRKK